MPFWKRKRADTVPASVSQSEIIGASVRTVEQVRNRYFNGRTAENVTLQERAHGTAFTLAMLNARVLSSCPIRLYKAVEGSRKSRTDPARTKHLRDYRKVGRKAAYYADRAGKVEEVLDHPFLDRIQDPNPNQSSAMFWMHIFANMQLFGNAYAAFDSNGYMTSLLSPYVRPVPANDDQLLECYELGREPTRAIQIKPENVIHLKWQPSLENPFLGVGPLHNLIAEMDLEDAALAAEVARWENGGSPAGIVSLKTTNATQIESTQSLFDRMYNGVRNAGRVMFFGDATYTPLSKAHELNYNEGFELLVQRMLASFGVPESLYRLNDANLASSLTGHTQYMGNTIQPVMSNVCEQLTDEGLPRYGLEPGRYFVAPDDMVPEDIEAKRNNVQILVPAGVMTINEAREEYGLDPIEGGDEPRINGQTLETLDTAPAVAPPAPFILNHSSRPEVKVYTDTPEAKARPLFWGFDDPYAPGEACGLCTKDVGEVVDGVGSEAYDGLRGEVEAWYNGIARDLDSYVASDGRVNLESAEADLLKRITPYLERAFASGALESLDKLVAGGFLEADDDGMFSLENVDATRYLEQRGSLIIEQVRGTTEDALSNRIRQGLQNGESLGELVPGVREAFAEATPARAEAIARTEVSNAIHSAELEQYKATGVEFKQWFNSPNPSPVHAEIARRSKKVSIDEPFIRAGESITAGGKTETYTRDVWAPPARPNCRCGIRPVRGDD